VLPFIHILLGSCRPALSTVSATLFDRLFDKSFLPDRSAVVRRHESRAITQLPISPDMDIANRLAATLRTELLLQFEQRIRIPELLPHENWEAMFRACGELMGELQRRVATMDRAIVQAAIASAEATYRCEFVVEESGADRQLVRAVNLGLREAVLSWSEIIAGTSTVDHALPRQCELLPLSCLGGSTPQDCFDNWHKRGKRQYSARKKYQLVTTELAEVLGGWQVEFMQPEHVEAYRRRLVDRGLAAGTIANKVGCVRTLLGSLPVPATTRRALGDALPERVVLEVMRTKRRAISNHELGALLTDLFNDCSLPADDRVIVALHALTGTRIEEVCSLDSSDLERRGEHWTMRICLSESEMEAMRRWMPQGKNIVGVKTIESLRVVPFFPGVVPGLRERLIELTKRPGPLFKHLSATSAGVRSSAVSKRLNRRIKALFGPECDIVLESRRNTASPLMRRAGVEGDHRRAFLGHAPIDVHSRNYDVLTVEDLIAAGRAVAEVVGQALEGKEFRRLDVQYDRYRRRLERQGAVKHEDIQAGATQQASFNAQQSEMLSSAQRSLEAPALNVSASRRPTGNFVGAVGPNFEPPIVREREVGGHGVVASTGGQERILGLSDEWDSTPFQDTRDHQFGQTAHRATASGKAKRSASSARADLAQEPESTRGLRRNPVGARPCLKEVVATASR